MELHRHWIVRFYGPLWIVAAVVCLLAPTLILPALEYEFMVGNWIAYPAGVLLLLIGAYYIRDYGKPYLLRFDQAGIVWRMSGNHGAVPWHDVVRFGLEKKPDDPPRVKPKHLTVWLRHPLPGAGDPDVQLDGLAGYRLASVRELAESAEEVVAGLRRFTPTLEMSAGMPAVAGGMPFGGAPGGVPFGGAPGGPVTGGVSFGGAPGGVPFGGAPGGPFEGAFGGAPATHADRRAPAEGECAVCGAHPAAYVVLQSVISAAVFLWSTAERGWRCRDCALATYRAQTARTLLGCWWGVGIVGGPIVVLANRLRMRPALRLGPPQPTPGVVAPSPRPLDPGPRLLARAGGIVGSVMAVVVTLLVAFVVVSVVVYG